MITNAKIVGEQVDSEAYHRTDLKRGDPQYPMSRGELVEFLTCPHRWRAGYKEDDDKQTESTAWGSLVDCLALDSKRFAEKYAVHPDTYQDAKTGEDKPWTFAANVCKAWKAENTGKLIIGKSDELEARKAIEILRADPKIKEMLQCSDKQVMVVAEWRDKETGIIVPLKALIDLVPDKDHPKLGLCLSDFKTCRNAGLRQWSAAVYEHGYHVQAAFYLDLFNAARKQERNLFFHVLQENVPPYETGRRILDETYIGLGRAHYLAALRRYSACVKSNEWPSYDDEGDKLMDGWNLVAPLPWMVLNSPSTPPAGTSEQAMRRAGL